MWPCLSEWVRWKPGLSYYGLFLKGAPTNFFGGRGFSKIGLPSLLCIRNHIHAQTMFINITNRHLLVAKDCTMKTLFANFSEWDTVGLQLQIVITRPVNLFWYYLHHFKENFVLSTVVKYLQSTKSINVTHFRGLGHILFLQFKCAIYIPNKTHTQKDWK